MLTPWIAATVTCLACSAGALPDDPPATPKLSAVESGSLTLTSERPGRIGSSKKTLVRFEPESFGGQVTVEKILVTPGMVKAGTVIATLKGKDFDKGLADLRTQVAEATERFAIQQEEATLGRASDAIALERAERSQVLTEQRFKHQREYYFPKALDLASVRMKDQADNLKDQGDELSQLERMYGDATLESETKDIVIGRARRGMDRTKIYYQYGLKDNDFYLAFDHPNTVKDAEDNLRYSQVGLDQLRVRQRFGAINSRLAIAGAERGLDDLRLKLTQFEADAKRMTVTAPTDGLMSLSIPDEGEQVGGKALLATIVDPGALELRGNLDVDSLRVMGAGSQVDVWLPTRPECTGAAVISELTLLGSADGTGANYPFVAAVQNRAGEWPLGAEARIVARTTIDGCTLVDNKAIKSAYGKSTVEVWVDGKKQDREIKIGASDGKKTQVFSGLAAGDQVVMPDV